MYGIPREHVIGSWGKTRFEQRDDQTVIHRESSFDVFLEKHVKVESIDHHIGKRPTIAVGDELLGAHIVGHNATELLHELLLAKHCELLPEDVESMIHAHPTISEAIMEAMRGVNGKPIHG